MDPAFTATGSVTLQVYDVCVTAKADGDQPSIDATPSAAWPGKPAFLVPAITWLEIQRLVS